MIFVKRSEFDITTPLLGPGDCPACVNRITVNDIAGAFGTDRCDADDLLINNPKTEGVTVPNLCPKIIAQA